MNSRIFKLWQEHRIALLAEIGLFLAFALSLIFLATLKTADSAGAVVPHILCNLAGIVLLVRSRMLGRPVMFWSHFDLVIVFLFLYFVGNIYYSEIRGVSWRHAALYLDCLMAYFIGRMLFYHRLRGFAVLLTVGLLLAWGNIYVAEHGTRKQEIAYRAEVKTLTESESPDRKKIDELILEADQQKVIADNLRPVRQVYLLFAVFWGISIVFLWLEKPSYFAFLFYGGVIAGLYIFYLLGYFSWFFYGTNTATFVEQNSARVESLNTAFRVIKSYPVVGSGLGTYSYLADAYRLTPYGNLQNGFSAYIYLTVETGIVGVMVFLYLLIRFPLHTLRRWQMFFHPRLRFAIVVHLIFIILFAFQSFFDNRFYGPAVWFPFWAVMGSLMSLVMVRDPIRIFDALLPEGRGMATEEQKFRAGRFTSFGSTFGRTPFARLPRPKLSVLKRLGFGHILFTGIVTVGVIALTALEIAPYAAANIAKLPQDGDASADGYGERLAMALKVFPLDSEIYGKIADHYDAKIQKQGALEIYQYSDAIQSALTKAISLNPYKPIYYEKLYFLYGYINRSSDALEVLQKGVQNNPNNLAIRLLLARELESVGDYLVATHHIKEIVHRIAPETTELYLRLAELYELQGMDNEAKSYYLQARQTVPDTPATRSRLERLGKNLYGVAM